MEQVKLRRWHIIDDDGSREVLIDPRTGSILSGIKVKHDRSAWPAFTQFAVRAEAHRVAAALREVAEEFDRPCRRLDHTREAQEHGIYLAEYRGLTLLAEPGVDFDERFVTAASSEALAERLEADGVHFGYDPSAGTLHLTRFEAGFPDFTWCDSLQPGPSFALEFHADGSCTEEDPRNFALRKLDLPANSSHLDRRAFVGAELARMGLEDVDPEFREVTPVAAFEIGAVGTGKTGKKAEGRRQS